MSDWFTVLVSEMGWTTKRSSRSCRYGTTLLLGSYALIDLEATVLESDGTARAIGMADGE